ncbi:uncharacterized protein LOC129569332 [Sitodiplosis mosellana]|uniref:uncharacterized protein LOC129569332 n=1 Tax=Sitodiplosis mosellana TaxID=263140 RepID=UPI00244403B5|nr:uncharacterized protein LOC129569332 [Sitodiplosis mosellana]
MGWLSLCIVFVSVYLVVAKEPNLFLSQQFDVQLNEGEKQYRLIQSNANLPQYGRCWTEAIRQIDVTCTDLNEKTQAMLALRFTKCFMAMSGGDRDAGSKLDACEDTECIGNMNERVFSVYTHFYTHTQNICFYLMHQVWHAETEKTIHLLKSHSQSVSKQLIEQGLQLELAGRLQINLLTQQREGLKLQQKLVAHGVNLSEVLSDSQNSLSRLTEQFRNSTIEQGRQLGDLFQRLSQFHNWIVGEYTFVEQIMYFSVLLGIIMLATTAKRAENCRFLLFLLAAVNILIESLFQKYFGADYFIEDLKIVLFESLWLIRKVFAAVMITVYVVMTVTYVDSQKLTLNLLQRINEQNAEIIQVLKDMKGKPIEDCSDRNLRHFDRPYSMRKSVERDENAAILMQRADEYYRRSRMTPSVIRELSVDKSFVSNVGVTTRLRSRQATPILYS